MKGEGAAREWPWAYGLLVGSVAVFLLWSLRPILSPFVLYGLLLLLLSPYAGSNRHRTLVWAATLLMALWLLTTLGGLLAPFILALVIAYILDPLVDALERRGWHRTWVILGLAVVGTGVVAIILIVGVPALVGQAASLLEHLPDAADRLQTWLETARLWLARAHLPFISPDTLAALGANLDPTRLAGYLQGREVDLLQRGWRAVLGVGRGVGVAMSLLGYLVLTPVLTIYLLRDFDRITGWVAALVPADRKQAWLGFVREYDGLLSRYLRGQLIEATLVGVLTWFGLFLSGFPYSGVVGVTAGVFNLIPYIGLPISVIPALVIAFLSGNIVANLLKVAIVFGVVQILDGTVTGPRIVGGSVGLHAVWVMLALALGGFFFGFVGLLLAMPAAVLAKLLLRDRLARYRASIAPAPVVSTGD